MRCGLSAYRRVVETRQWPAGFLRSDENGLVTGSGAKRIAKHAEPAGGRKSRSRRTAPFRHTTLMRPGLVINKCKCKSNLTPTRMGLQVNSRCSARFAVQADQGWIFQNFRAGNFKEYYMSLFTQDKISAVQKANAEMLFKLAGKFFDGFEKLTQLNLQVLKATMSERTEMLQKARDSQNRLGFFDRLCRNKTGCYAAGDKTNDVIDEAD